MGASAATYGDAALCRIVDDYTFTLTFHDRVPGIGAVQHGLWQLLPRPDAIF